MLRQNAGRSALRSNESHSGNGSLRQERSAPRRGFLLYQDKWHGYPGPAEMARAILHELGGPGRDDAQLRSRGCGTDYQQH